MAKLKPSTNHKNRERNFNGSRYNFHSTISDTDKESILSSIDSKIEAEKSISTVKVEPKNLGMLIPNRTIDIPLENLVEAPPEWNYFPLPGVDTLKDIARSIYSQGQLSPALVWAIDDNKYMILGGHTRFKILEFLKEAYPKEKERFSKMKCHVYDKDQIGEHEAQYLIITNNMTQRAKESTGIMVKSIVRAFELQKSISNKVWGQHKERSNEIVARNFGIGARSVDRLYRLRTLIPELLNLLDNGDMIQSTAVKLATMPEDIQKLFFDSECYIYNINARQEAQIRDAKTVDDIINIFTKRQYSFSPKKVYLDYQIPKNFEKISIAISKDDLPIIKTQLLKIADSLSDESKKVLLDILQ